VNLLGRRILALLIFFVIMAAGAFATTRLLFHRLAVAPESSPEQDARPLPKEPGLLGSTEIFMPNTLSDGHFFISASDTRELSSLISRAAESTRRIAVDGGPDAHGTARSQDLLTRAVLLDSLGALVGIADEMTVYSPFVEDNRMYAAFVVDDAKFDSLMAGMPENTFSVMERPDGDAWTIEISGGGALYVTRSRSGGMSLLRASNSEEGLTEMKGAAADPSMRLSLPRNTEGKNHVSVNFSTPVLGRGFSIGEAEASWSANRDGIRVRYFTDLSARSPHGPRSDFIPETVPLFGEGNLALFASANLSYLLRAVYPDAADPVNAALKGIEGRVTPAMLSDIEAILKNCRLSAAVVAKEDLIGTAYVLLDTDKLESLGRIFSFVGTFLEKTAGPDEWEAYDLPMKNGRAFVARRGRFAMLGLGKASAYAARLDLPANAAGMCAASCGAGVFASSELMSLRAPGMGKTLAEALSERRSGDGWELAALVKSMENVDHFSLTHSMGGWGDINITFAERADGGS
jgi:hypothetical protein